jgi:hypothetical protein
MSIIWEPEEVSLLEQLRPCLSTEEIVGVFAQIGLARSSEAICKKSRKCGFNFRDLERPDTSGFNPKTITAVNNIMQMRNLQGPFMPTIYPTPAEKGKATAKAREVLGSLLEELQEIRLSVPQTGSISMRRATGTGESLVLVLSDWHFGQVVQDSETNKELYNTEIAKQRVARIPSMLYDTFGLDRTCAIDECIVVLGGDMVTGELIFPHQAMMTDNHAAEQVKSVTKTLWHLLKELHKMFPLVRVVTTRGNHGRTMASPEANWDNIVYQQLELLIDLDQQDVVQPDMTIKNRYGDYATLDIRGWKSLIRHSAPVQADTAAGMAKFASWGDIHQWDLFVFGHFHHWGVMTWNGKPIIRNGSVVGGDEYSEGFAKCDNSVQVAFLVDDDNPCKLVVPLKLGD